ncbi:translocation/assembly module TamB domain-containing protein [Lentisalinibacter sediminis]|uniref:translocation/assembly module TamB domain-containing protein n=1 Tax=Lentisalinibacter sediminis TaxID=2992237 RepID=UPI003869A5DF
MRLFRAILYLLIGLIATAVVLTTLVVATPAGLRLALDVAEPYLPSALELGEVDGTLAGGVVLRGGAWRGEAVTVEVRQLELELDPWPLIRRDIRLERLRALGVSVTIAAREAAGGAEEPQQPGGRFRFRMPVPLAIEEGRLEDVRVSAPGWSRSARAIEVAAAMRGSRLQADRLVLDSDWLRLEARGEARLVPPYRLRLNADWGYGGDDAGPALAGSGRFEGDADAWTVTHRLRQPEEVRTEGTVELREAGFHARLRNEVATLELPLDGNRILTVAEGRVTLEGWLDAYTAEARARLATAGIPAVNARATGRGSLETLEVERLRLASEAGSLEADGSLGLLPSREWDVAFRLQELETGAWGAPLQGTLSASGRSTGQWPAESAPGGMLRIEELTGRYGDEPLAGRGEVELGEPGKIAARGVQLAVGQNRFTLDGRLAPEPDLKLTVQAPRVETVWPLVQGDLRGDVALSGSFAEPVVEGTLETDGLRGQGLSVGAARLQVSPAATGSRLRLVAAQVEAGEVSFASVRVRAEGSPDAHDLALELEADSGTAGLQATGGLTDGAWSGQLRALRITQPQVGDWRLDESVALTVAPPEITLGLACLTGEGRGTLCLEASRDAEAARMSATARRVPVALLAPFFPAGSRFDGEAAGKADLTWQSGVLDGSADLTVEDARVEVMLDEDRQTGLEIRSFTARASVERNAARIEAELDLGEQGDGEAWLQTADLFDPAAPVDGLLRLDFRELSMVPLLVPELAQVRGHVMGRVEIAGRRREPRLGGALRLREAGFLFPDAGIEITELELVARQDEAGVIDYEGSARSGDGMVRIRGTTQRADEAGWISRFSVEGQDFVIVRLPDMQATASPDLDILLDERRLEVRGTIEVPEADITLRELGGDAVRTSPDTVVHGRTEAGEERLGPALFVELEVALGESVHLRGFGLETDLTGSLRLTGGSERPWLGFGRLSLVDARYKAYGQELTVERGELAFSGPLTNPAVDIRAVRDTGEVLAGVRIGGTVRSPSSTVFSEPPLPEAEALSYLLTGRPLAGTTSAEGNVLNRAALSLGLSRAGAIASQVSQEVGLDTLAVEGGADDGRVLAGKRLSEDLYLEYAWGIFDSIGTLLVRYDLSERLRLESRSGEQHAVDLVYRVERD